MTNFVIEGCDCTGKTSLIKEFLKHKDFRVIKCSAPPSNLSSSQQKRFCQNEYISAIQYLNNNDDVIYDRCFLGEAVYGPIMRGYYPEYIRSLEKKLDNNTVLVVLTANQSIVKKRFDGKFITEDLIKPILLCFNAQFLLSNVKRKIFINTSYKTPEEIYGIIQKQQY